MEKIVVRPSEYSITYRISKEEIDAHISQSREDVARRLCRSPGAEVKFEEDGTAVVTVHKEHKPRGPRVKK